MKNIKNNIVYILLGFTFVISIYSTIKLTQLESDISYVDSDLYRLKREVSDLEGQISQIDDLEYELSTLKQNLRMNLGIILY